MRIAKTDRQARLLPRITALTTGLLFTALGVVFTTKASLGTSPISSIPYVLSLSCPLSLGLLTVLFSVLLMLLQLLLLRRRFRAYDLLQLPVSVVFGLFIDGAMLLLRVMQPEGWAARLGVLTAGCVFLGFGVFLEASANLIMLPGEATAKALSAVTALEFSTAKIVCDTAMVVIAVLCSLLLSGKIRGVGAGTVAAALLVGLLAKLFLRLFRRVRT